MAPKATKYSFTPAQLHHIHSFFPEFEAQVRKLDPDHKGNCKKLTQWKHSVASQLLDEELFEDLDMSSNSPDSWKDVSLIIINVAIEILLIHLCLKAISRQFSNYFSHHIKTKASKGTPSSLEPHKKAYSSVTQARPFIIFSGSVSARQLFIFENNDAITTLYKKISKESKLPGGGARQQAIQKLWSNANQTEWEDKAQALHDDIDS